MIPNLRPEIVVHSWMEHESVDDDAPTVFQVIAWDNDGHPLIVGYQGLVRAETEVLDGPWMLDVDETLSLPPGVTWSAQ